MRNRLLGRTGIPASEIGFGAWGIGKQLWSEGDDAQAWRALHLAADLNINFFDTALIYGNGHSERLIGRFLQERPERLYVATKVPPRNLRWPAQGALEEVFPPSHIVQCTESSLRNLGVERIDLQQLHVWEPSWLEREEWFETLSDLQRQGKIAYFGISINDHQPNSALDLVASGRVDTIQVIHNIFDQSAEQRLFQLCLEHNVGVIARVPFDEGALTGNITPETTFPRKDFRAVYFKGDRKREVYERIEALRPLLGDEARELPELALKFCLHHPAVSTVIAGMRRPEHVRRNAAVSDSPPLSEGLVRKLRAHRWDKNFYP